MKSRTFPPRYLILLIFICFFFSNGIYGQSNSDSIKSVINQNDAQRKAGIKSPDDLLNGFEQLENLEKIVEPGSPLIWGFCSLL